MKFSNLHYSSSSFVKACRILFLVWSDLELLINIVIIRTAAKAEFYANEELFVFVPLSSENVSEIILQVTSAHESSKNLTASPFTATLAILCDYKTAVQLLFNSRAICAICEHNESRWTISLRLFSFRKYNYYRHLPYPSKKQRPRRMLWWGRSVCLSVRLYKFRPDRITTLNLE